jgi:hypothetical protein
MKYLDIAGGEAPHCFIESLEHPEGFYVCVDTRTSRYSPEVWYWKTKEFLFNDSRYRHGASKKGGNFSAIVDDIVIASWLIDVPPSNQGEFLRCVGGVRDPDYYNLATLAGKLKAYPEGSRILASKVSEDLCNDEQIVRVFNNRFPRFVGEPEGDKRVFHSGFYAWSLIEQLLFGGYSDLTMEELLGMKFPPAMRRKVEDACSRIHFVEGDMYDLPFKDKSFDYVRGSGIPDLQEEKPMSEARRVLKNGNIVSVGISGIDTECE